MTKTRHGFLAFAAAVVAAFIATTPVGAAAQENREPYSVAFRPERLPPTKQRIDSLRLQPGFRINVFARRLGYAA